MKEIGEFKGEYFYLSNFYGHGPKGISVESQFQSRKVGPGNLRDDIIRMSPHASKRAGNKVSLRKDWEQVKVPIMARFVAIKFLNRPKLQEKLISTGKANLIEGNTWHDNFWGDCRCGHDACAAQGHNTLGVILMGVRESLVLG